ncbi:MAG TPA: lysophospholipid acyltransferase family protein [Vicinamibacterales bacterium]|nr:lysophospholipid acyltransferase family protein [Vicinamibacterales bacterium]
MTLPAGKRRKAALIAALGWPVIEGLGGTYHWHTVGAEYRASVQAAGRPPVLGFWHGRSLEAILYFRDSGVTAMTSQNFDGEWISRLMERFGHEAARGSTSRGGSRALVVMRRALERGRAAAFTLDGPRGPAKIAQPGAIWLAGATGHPLLPVHFEASSYWTVGSWDRHQIPKPGSHIVAAFGEPVAVESTAPEIVEARRLDLEHALARLELQAREALIAAAPS